MGITAHHSTRDSLAELWERRPGDETIAHSTSSNTNSNSNPNTNSNTNSNSNSKTSC
jgi:hypothetical protein